MIPQLKVRIEKLEEKAARIAQVRTAGMLTNVTTRGVTRRPISTVDQLQPQTTKPARWA